MQPRLLQIAFQELSEPTMMSIRFLAVAALATASSQAFAQTKYPGLNYLLPNAVQRGRSATVLVETNGDVGSAYLALVEGSGIQAKVLPRLEKQAVGQAKVEFKIEPDASLGLREVRLVTKQAITTLGTLLVVDAPIEDENSANDSADQAQSLKFPVAVCGRTEKPVDEDWFKFEAKAGERFAFTTPFTRSGVSSRTLTRN
jgi:hypothetical protein